MVRGSTLHLDSRGKSAGGAVSGAAGARVGSPGAAWELGAGCSRLPATCRGGEEGARFPRSLSRPPAPSARLMTPARFSDPRITNVTTPCTTTLPTTPILRAAWRELERGSVLGFPGGLTEADVRAMQFVGQELGPTGRAWAAQTTHGPPMQRRVPLGRSSGSCCKLHSICIAPDGLHAPSRAPRFAPARCERPRHASGPLSDQQTSQQLVH